MYGISTYIYHKNQPNVGKYTIHGSYGLDDKQTQKKMCVPVGRLDFHLQYSRGLKPHETLVTLPEN